MPIRRVNGAGASRRSVLRGAGGALGAAALTAASAGLAEAAGGRRCHRRIPPSGIGMHLYTMRTALAADFPGTLTRLAATGYATVGVSGRHGRTAAQIRAVLDDVGLRAVLEHVGYDVLRGPGLGTALDDVRVLGGQWVVVPSLPRALHTPAGFRQAAREFNRIGAAARAAGLGPLLFHNHGADHQVVDGENLYDILVRETDPEFVAFELDLYWAVKGGANPRSLFVRHRRRFPALHVKDMASDGSIADVGSGVLDFPSMFDRAGDGGVQQWLVEHDAPADPFTTALTSYRYLSRLRF